MTTTMPRQQEIIAFLEDKGLRDRFKVVIGGAPTTRSWGEKIGADLWCEDANSAARALARLKDKD
jgi:methanogenic corrinoid protein MtbC1